MSVERGFTSLVYWIATVIPTPFSPLIYQNGQRQTSW